MNNSKNNKVLMYMNIDMLKPKGGPFGYLYNLKKGLEEIKESNIEFLDNTKYNDEKEKKGIQKFIKKIYNIFPKFIKKMFQNYKLIKFYNLTINGEKKNNQIEFNNYQYIHFHSTFDMYSVKDSLSKYNGKIILTTHSPKPTYLERIDNLINEDTYKKVAEKYKGLEQVDEYAFENADYIVFPCEEAEEPYYNQWDKYIDIKEKNKEKYRYILTGIPKCTAKLSKNKIRNQYNIPEDSFLISYIGRHNEVKGYDILKEIGAEILNNKDIYIIIGGKEGPLYRLENKRWIEVGWTDDPHSIISASDLFILPNRETYFDLVLLEVLSLGMPVLISNTGGNKYFKKYEDSGIFYFSNTNEAISKIIELSKLDKKSLEKLGQKNQKIFEKDFNEKIFAKNYIQLIESLK